MTNNNIINNLSDSFKYIISDPIKIFIGVVFYLIPLMLIDIISFLLNIEIIDSITGSILMMVTFIFLMIPITILINGYYVKIMRTTLEDVIILPEWVGFFNLFMDGILFIIGQILVFIAFMIIPLIMMIIGAIVIMFAGMFEIIGYVFMFIGMLLFLLFMILCGFYIILANITFAKSGFFGFFDYKEVLNKFSIEYVLLAIIIFVLLIVLGIVIGVVLLIPSILLALINNAILTFVFSLITSLISSILSITMSIFSYRIYATYYKNVA